MKINKTLRTYRFLLMLLLITIVACTNEDDQFSNNLLVGLWMEATTPLNYDEPRYSNDCYHEGPDAGYGGTWVFEKDGKYQLDFAFGSIAGPRFGRSVGTYDLIADSVLALNVTFYEFQDSVYNVDLLWKSGKDTHYVTITDSSFVDHFSEHDCSVFWNWVK